MLFYCTRQFANFEKMLNIFLLNTNLFWKIKLYYLKMVYRTVYIYMADDVTHFQKEINAMSILIKIAKVLEN